MDFSASSGKQTHWHTQLGGGDLVYPNRAAEDRKLLTYTGPPLASDVEITGSLVLTLAGSVTWTVFREQGQRLLSRLAAEAPVKPCRPRMARRRRWAVAAYGPRRMGEEEWPLRIFQPSPRSMKVMTRMPPKLKPSPLGSTSRV